ncbi:MAG: tetratricopeptide repeat protein [Sandaracinus sp.]|nr:tetratricopeptide repeat protein [Sandaracinus sp.]
MKRRVLAFAFVALFAAPVSAQHLDAFFTRGREAYLEGRYDDAIAAWERLREAGVRDANVEYDLGLAHVQRDRYGAAMLSFERALRVDPSDSDASQALASARSVLAERRAEREGVASLGDDAGFAEVLVRPFAEPLLSWLLVGLEALLLVLGVALVRLPRLRAALAIATAITSLLFVAVGTGLLVKRRVFEDGRRAIVVTEEAALREGPDERTARRGAAHEGDAVHLLGEEEEWVLVELGAQRGWVRRDHVGVVD